MVFCNLPFYFHGTLNCLYVHLDIWAHISLFTQKLGSSQYNLSWTSILYLFKKGVFYLQL